MPRKASSGDLKTDGGKDGKQSITQRGDYGARSMWDAAANPPSVKAMVGTRGELSRYKHDQK